MRISKNNTINFAIFLVWLFHISGLLGIYFGNTDWFIAKSPLNLTISLFLFFLFYPLNTIKKVKAFSVFFVVGMLAEWLGITYGILFGDYVYGNNLGFKLDGVPYLIGSYWALLTFITAEIAKKIVNKTWFKITLGASLMVSLDFLMEKSAPVFNFWEFNGNVPLENYITWFLIGFLMHLILDRLKIQGNSKISFHLYFAQIVFFAFFYLFPI